MVSSISIIIPIWNAEKTLERCLKSVLASIEKTRKSTEDEIKFEVICVNDGSTDSSGEIISEYEKNFKIIRNIKKNNEGASDARNKGIDIASGEYIMFCDSDDEFDEKCLKYIVEDIKKYTLNYICFKRITVNIGGGGT